MSSPTANGTKSSANSSSSAQKSPNAPGQGRVERRREWWSKNKDFRSKLRDRTTMSKKENSQEAHTPRPKVDTSRGFRSSVATKLAASSKQKKAHTVDAKSSSQPKLKPNPKGNPKLSTTQNKMKGKPKAVPKPVPAAKAEKIEERVDPELVSEISMNARGVELSSVGNYVPQRYILFVGNLPYTIDKGQLMSHFRKTGGVKHIRIPKNKEGTPKGFAYIEFKDRISHGIALRLHHTTLGGRRINVEFSTSEAKKSGLDSS